MEIQIDNKGVSSTLRARAGRQARTGRARGLAIEKLNARLHPDTTLLGKGTSP